MVITSLSFSVFAAGEQPSGSAYNYTNTSGSSATGTYWVATTNGLYSLTSWLSNIRGTTFWYFDGDNTQSTSNFFNALSYSLFYIGRSLNQLSIPTNYWSSSNVSNIVADVDAANTTVQSIYTKLGTMDTRLSAIDADTTAIRSDSTSIKTNTSTTATNTTTIAGRLPSGNYAYVRDNGDGVAMADSTLPYWRAVTTSLTHSGMDIDDINEKMPTGYYAWMGASSATSSTNSTRTYWSAISGSLAYMGQDIEIMKNDIIDLHYMFASPEDIALKQDQENNISAATSNFLSGSDSATSVGTGSIGKVKDLGDDAATWFDTGVQATSLFDALSNTNNDGPWIWFTQATMDDLDSTSRTRSTKSSSSPGEYVPDLYGAKMDELDRMLDAFSE